MVLSKAPGITLTFHLYGFMIKFPASQACSTGLKLNFIYKISKALTLTSTNLRILYDINIYIIHGSDFYFSSICISDWIDSDF
jgi:hypothetical protein